MSDEQKQQTGLAKIRQEFQSPQAINMFKDAMPAASDKQALLSAKRFGKMTYAVISQSASLQKCTVTSLIRAASLSASLDLDIDARGLAYLVPYGNEANFQIGYLGLIELAYRSGKVKSISAHCIYESEQKNVIIIRRNGQYSVEHPFSYEKPLGKVVAVYATAIIDGIDPQTIVLRNDEIEFYRSKSKAPNSPAWKEYYEAMAKKTAIRQLAKFLPKSILEDLSRAVAIDEEEERKYVDSAIMDEPQQSTADRIKNKLKDKETPEILPAEEPKAETPKDKKNTGKKADEKPKEKPKSELQPASTSDKGSTTSASIPTTSIKSTPSKPEPENVPDPEITEPEPEHQYKCERCERTASEGGKCKYCYGAMLKIQK
jgi:recombination protein RecT